MKMFIDIYGSFIKRYLLSTDIINSSIVIMTLRRVIQGLSSLINSSLVYLLASYIFNTPY